MASLSYLAWGGCTKERGGGSALVLDAACLHLILHYVSLSHISILLWGSPSVHVQIVSAQIVSGTNCIGTNCIGTICIGTIPNHKIPNHKKNSYHSKILTKPRILVRLG